MNNYLVHTSDGLVYETLADSDEEVMDMVKKDIEDAEGDISWIKVFRLIGEV